MSILIKELRTLRVKSFRKEDNDWKTRVINETEIISNLKESLLNLDEGKYSFFNGVNKKGEMEYLFLTYDNYIAYYVVPFHKGNRISIDKLTERIKIENGLLYRWNKENKRFEKANVIRIEKCFLCRIKFFRRKLIDNLKKRVIFNVSIANIKNKDKLEFIKRMIYDK